MVANDLQQFSFFIADVHLPLKYFMSICCPLLYLLMDLHTFSSCFITDLFIDSLKPSYIFYNMSHSL